MATGQPVPLLCSSTQVQGHELKIESIQIKTYWARDANDLHNQSLWRLHRHDSGPNNAYVVALITRAPSVEFSIVDAKTTLIV